MAVGWASEESAMNEQAAVINKALSGIVRSYSNICSCGRETPNVVLCDQCLEQRRSRKKVEKKC